MSREQETYNEEDSVDCEYNPIWHGERRQADTKKVAERLLTSLSDKIESILAYQKNKFEALSPEFVLENPFYAFGWRGNLIYNARYLQAARSVIPTDDEILKDVNHLERLFQKYINAVDAVLELFYEVPKDMRVPDFRSQVDKEIFMESGDKYTEHRNLLNEFEKLKEEINIDYFQQIKRRLER